VSLLSCHSAGFTPATHAAIPGQLSPVAEATITDVVDVNTSRHQSYALLPVTVNGHTATVILDLGSSVNLLSRRMMTQFGGDSVTIGTTVQRNVSFVPFEGIGGDLIAHGRADGLLGTPVLSQYDLVFAGPVQRVRLYPLDTSDTIAAHDATWRSLHAHGVAGMDCHPFTDVAADENGAEGFVGLTLRANGHPLSSYFDSGAKRTNMTWATASVLGLTRTSPQVHLIPADSVGSFVGGTTDSVWVVTGVTLTVGAHRLTPGSVYINSGYPIQGPVLNLGLDAVRDRILVVSYSANQVCLSDPIPSASGTSTNDGQHVPQ
jgi:hypothetical protein